MPHLERLQHLRRVVARIDVNAFTMSAWQRDGKACALVHACLDQWHNEAGLKFEEGVPQFEDQTGYHAASRFYDLTRAQTLQIFSIAEYPIRKHLACVKEEMVKRIDAIMDLPQPGSLADDMI